MFESAGKSTGSKYTLTVALLAVAFIFSPATLILSGSSGYVPIALAVACSVISLILAWVIATKYSNGTIPSISAPDSRPK